MKSEVHERSIAWRLIGESVRGASHERSGLPNQDAWGWYPESGEGPPVILAVADGHGSAKYFRSDVGAQLAVQTAVRMLGELVDQLPESGGVASVKRIAEDALPRSIVRSWREAVVAHLEEHPIQASEWETLQKSDGEKGRHTVEADPAICYGATLLAVLISESFMLYLQLGDGAILAVDGAGDTSWAIPRDKSLIANETTSLCLADAVHHVRLRVVPVADSAPVLVILSSDGYCNSFREEKDPQAFERIGGDYLRMLREQGLSAVERAVPQFLEEASQRGSGDDITLAMAKRMEPGDLDVQVVTERRVTALEQQYGELQRSLAALREHHTGLQRSVRVSEEHRSESEQSVRRIIDKFREVEPALDQAMTKATVLESKVSDVLGEQASIQAHLSRMQRLTRLTLAALALVMVLLFAWAGLIASRTGVADAHDQATATPAAITVTPEHQ